MVIGKVRIRTWANYISPKVPLNRSHPIVVVRVMQTCIVLDRMSYMPKGGGLSVDNMAALWCRIFGKEGCSLPCVLVSR